jgi:cytochrome d ubiquinol oxidase subunit I
VPGINDLVFGNEKEGIEGVGAKMERGTAAFNDLNAFKDARAAGDTAAADAALASFRQNEDYLGYAYLEKPEDAVPPVQTTYYSFHIMVYYSLFAAFIFLAYLAFTMKDTITEKRWLLPLGIASFFLAMVASQAGWATAEVGRQPWAIFGMLPVGVATSNLDTWNVIVTFWMFAGLFTLLLLAEIKIMLWQIKKGPEGA